MALYSLKELVKGIADTLSAAPSLTRTQYAGAATAEGRLTEGMPDLPALQVYPEENPGTSAFSDTDRLSLSGVHSLKKYLIHADLYVRQRSHIDEDMAAVLDSVNEIEDILDNLTYPLFGLSFVTSFRWSWRRVTFEYANVGYVGARFFINIVCGSGG